MSDLRVTDNSTEHRYELWAGEQLAGFAVYRATPDNVVIVHTEIEPDFRGQALGDTLAAGALDDVRRQHKSVTPLCEFMAAYIARHPDYSDLVSRP
jgi:uncharacterized protein